jgi:hypothetical protein
MTLVGVSTLTGDVSPGLTVAGGIVGLLVVGGIVWWSWRFVKRRVNRGHWLWQRALLRVRAVVLPIGPRREIVSMRLALHDNLAQTQRVLRLRAARDAIPRSLTDLLPPLERLIAGLDAELQLWQTEPDAALVLDAVPELRDRGHTLIEQAVAVRTGALRALDDADRLTRRPAEEELRDQLEGSHGKALPIPRLQASSEQPLDHPLV